MYTFSEAMAMLSSDLKDKNWPGSLIETLAGTVYKSRNQEETLQKVREIIKTAENPREAARAVQPIIREMCLVKPILP